MSYKIKKGMVFLSQRMLFISCMSGWLLLPGVVTGKELPPNPETTVTLRYAEPKQDEGQEGETADTGRDREYRGGSLVSNLQDVADRIGDDESGNGSKTDKAGDNTEERLQALLKVKLTPRLIPEQDSDTFKVTLNIHMEGPVIPEDMKPKSRRQLSRDASLLRANLNRWSKTLSAKEAEQLRGDKKLELPVSKPFSIPRLFKPDSTPKVMVLWEGEEEISLRFVVRKNERIIPVSGDLYYGVPFMVEVKLSEPDNRYSFAVYLEWNGNKSRPVTVRQVSGQKRKLYRSGVLVLERPDADLELQNMKADLEKRRK